MVPKIRRFEKLVLSALEVFKCGAGGRTEWCSWSDRLESEKYCIL